MPLWFICFERSGAVPCRQRCTAGKLYLLGLSLTYTHIFTNTQLPVHAYMHTPVLICFNAFYWNVCAFHIFCGLLQVFCGFFCRFTQFSFLWHSFLVNTRTHLHTCICVLLPFVFFVSLVEGEKFIATL